MYFQFERSGWFRIDSMHIEYAAPTSALTGVRRTNRLLGGVIMHSHAATTLGGIGVPVAVIMIVDRSFQDCSRSSLEIVASRSALCFPPSYEERMIGSVIS